MFNALSDGIIATGARNGERKREVFVSRFESETRQSLASFRASRLQPARPGIQDLKKFWMPVFTGMTANT